MQICHPSRPCHFMLGCEFVPVCPPTASVLDIDWVERPASCPGGFPGILGRFICTLGLWLSLGAPTPTTRSSTLLCSLYYTYCPFFLCFRTHLFIAPSLPPSLCPDSQITALLLLFAHWFQLCWIPTQIRSCYLGNVNLISVLWLSWYRWLCKSPHPKASLPLCDTCWVSYTKDASLQSRFPYLCPVK